MFSISVGSEPVPFVIILVTIATDELTLVTSVFVADDAEVICAVLVNLILSVVLLITVGSEPVPVDMMSIINAIDELILVTSALPADDADVVVVKLVNLILPEVFSTNVGIDPVPCVTILVTIANDELIISDSVVVADDAEVI